MKKMKLIVMFMTILLFVGCATTEGEYTSLYIKNSNQATTGSMKAGEAGAIHMAAGEYPAAKDAKKTSEILEKVAKFSAKTALGHAKKAYTKIGEKK